MADDSHHPAHLSPSELGTKDYWETFYARTLSHLSTKHNPSTTTTAPKPTKDNQASDSENESDADTETDDIDDDSDPGTSWFSEHNAPDKVLQFLTDDEFPLSPANTTIPSGEVQQQPSILDLGTGNGSMLALLRKRGGFRGDMVGVDYSIRSVELARELQRLRIHSAYLSDSDDESDSGSEGEEGGEGEKEGGGKDKDTNIRFEEWDILHHDETENENKKEKKERLDWFPYDKGGFDIVLDKGTFDAVSLSDEVVVEGDREGEDTAASGRKIQRRVCERYPGIVRGLVRKGGFVVVTSCNWTEEELVNWFTSTSTGTDEGAGDRLVVWGRVEYPRFRFGGREGQGVCTVCFQRVEGEKEA
ncbi:hypothetical protein BO78DRAFT_396586 [Aspergillus sclerotiicarbonarius CBS 121057]|uniref:Protein-lysine N-methyltransferase EFM4 n=1 Tax=Aspergillus sclerotiicarbonarius (strain CBS 121057 / IBT 28362) TaxID=1448318 RepID=A0A319EAX2_ASPSB|nr:hypothetical protein BO78DRAFT_396586 [Aspergillus sclerotiicarbonarius CBS 121057]